MTQNQKQLSRKFLAYKLLTNLWFIGGIWLYFYRLFITDSQVGILDGIAFAIGLIAEVPSGVLADKFGRDKITKLGLALSGIGILIQAFASSFIPFFFGQTIMLIGVSFVSGADEALFFDKLKFQQSSREWRKLITRGSQISLIGSMSAIIIGGWLYTISPRLPWILTGLVFIGSVLLIWPLKETRAASRKLNLSEELKAHIRSIKSGFTEFTKPKLLLYVPIIVSVQGLFYTASWGILRLILLDRFHFNPLSGSAVIASCSLISVGILTLTHKYAGQMRERRILMTVSLLAGFSLIVSLADIGLWGYFVILTLFAGSQILYPLMSEIINYRAPERHRATVLSIYSFLRTLPYVLLAPIIGYLNTQNKLEYFLISWTLIIITAIILYLSIQKKDSQIAL